MQRWHALEILTGLSKAFDTIDHKALLKHYGVWGRALALCTSYLSNRRQCVSTLGELSEYLPVIYVLRGSCLGSLLFLIYINDIGNICISSEIILFAEAYEAGNKILRVITT